MLLSLFSKDFTLSMYIRVRGDGLCNDNRCTWHLAVGSYRQLSDAQPRCCEQNAGPLQEPYELLTSKPSLQP